VPRRIAAALTNAARLTLTVAGDTSPRPGQPGPARPGPRVPHTLPPSSDARLTAPSGRPAVNRRNFSTAPRVSPPRPRVCHLQVLSATSNETAVAAWRTICAKNHLNIFPKFLLGLSLDYLQVALTTSCMSVTKI